jgi:CheY-like chemotaxis protein
MKKQELSESFSKEYPMRILVAEDNEINQKLIIKILSKLGYPASLAKNGKEVLEMADLARYDLILMDVQMPEMDGLEATRMVRLCLEKQPIIIAMTANALDGDQDICIQAGMDDYISKPVEFSELIRQLEKWGGAMKSNRK